MVNHNGTVEEVLPQSAVDNTGTAMGFAYSIENDQQILVTATDEYGFVSYGWWDNWGKCAAGAIGGGLTGLVGGAALGPWGAAGGGVGGVLTGAAASC